MSDPVNPAAIERQKSSLRIAKSEAEGINKRINQQERAQLHEYRELGLRLLTVKASCGHGEYGGILDELGIAHQRASEALAVAEYWTKVPERGSLNSFLKAKRANLFVEVADGTESPKVQVTHEKPETETEPLTSHPSTPPDVGDAAEDVPEGLLVDPDGEALPESAKEAMTDHPALLGWCERLHAMLKELKGITERPSRTAAFVAVKRVVSKVQAGYRMAYAQRLTADRTYRCDDCKGKGGECKRCEGLGFIPETRRGDQWSAEPKPKAKPFYRGRRRQ